MLRYAGVTCTAGVLIQLDDFRWSRMIAEYLYTTPFSHSSTASALMMVEFRLLDHSFTFAVVREVYSIVALAGTAARRQYNLAVGLTVATRCIERESPRPLTQLTRPWRYFCQHTTSLISISCHFKLEWHSVERMYLRQRRSHGSR